MHAPLLITRLSRRDADRIERIEPHEYAANNIFARQRAPQARVIGYLSVVSHDEVLIRRERYGHTGSPTDVRGVEIGFRKRECRRICWRDGNAIARYGERVAREAYNTFDERLTRILRELEHDHVSSLGGFEVV